MQRIPPQSLKAQAQKGVSRFISRHPKMVIAGMIAIVLAGTIKLLLDRSYVRQTEPISYQLFNAVNDSTLLPGEGAGAVYSFSDVLDPINAYQRALDLKEETDSLFRKASLNQADSIRLYEINKEFNQLLKQYHKPFNQ